MSARKVPWIAALIIGVFIAQVLLFIAHTSPTTDETPFHTVNGYVYLKTRDYRMNPSSPALIREWMALPWFLFQPKLDLTKEWWAEAESEPFGREFVYKDNRAIAANLIYSSKFMILLLGVALALLIYRWSRRLYGPEGGLTALVCYAFSPSFIAHSGVAATDVGAAFLSCLSAFMLWIYLEDPKPKRLWIFALILGLTFAAKINTLILGPAFLFVILARRGWKDFAGALAAVSAATFLIIWASYLFEFKPLLGGGVPRIEEKLEMINAIVNVFFPGSDSMKRFFQNAALSWPIPIPSYLLAIGGIARHHGVSQSHFAFGRWTSDSVWYHYFFLFFTKMTLPFLFLLFINIFASFRRNIKNVDWVIWVPAGVYFTLMCFEGTANGSRYLFPIIPLLFVWTGGVWEWAKNIAWKRALWTGLLGVSVVVGLRAYPDYLSYFNAFVGSENGFKYVRDSDVDWGQGLKALKKEMDRRGIESVTLEYFGTADPSYFGVRHTPLLPEDVERPDKKAYAISLQFFEHVRWSHAHKPTAVVGGGIALFDFREAVQ